MDKIDNRARNVQLILYLIGILGLFWAVLGISLNDFYLVVAGIQIFMLTLLGIYFNHPGR